MNFSVPLQVPDAAVAAVLNHACVPQRQLPARHHDASSGVTSWSPLSPPQPCTEDRAPPAARDGAPAGSISTGPSSSLSSATLCARVFV